MLRMFRTINGQVEQIQKPENGSWLCLSAPTDVELANVSMETGIDLADLRAPLDDEERSRVDVKDDYTMIIVDLLPWRNAAAATGTRPSRCRSSFTQSAIITVCMQDTPVLHPFMEGTIRGFNTYMKTRFILQILYRNATMYLRYLRIIDRESDKLELKLRHSMQNREILMLLELSKTLVYFTTSLNRTTSLLEKLTTLPRLKQYPEDEDLLDDVITENKQAINGQHLQRRSRQHDRRVRIDRVEQPEQRDAHLHHHLHHPVDSDPDLLHVRHELPGRHARHAPHGQAMGLRGDHRHLTGLFGDRHLVPHPVAHVQVTSMMGKARYVAAAACAALLAAGAGACGTSDSVVTEGAAQGPMIAIGVAADQPGLGYLHGGEYSGFDIDVAKYVAKTLGYAEKQIVFKQLSPAMRASALTDGTVDMVVDFFSMDATHDGEADVAGPYLTVREALLIRSDSASEITGTDSLSDKTVCAVAGSAAYDNIRSRTKNTRTTVAERDTYPQCMTALMIGEADAVAADDAISAGLASNNTGDHLKIVDVPDTTWSYGIAVKSGQDELVGQIDAALRAMVKDGSWQKAAADMGKSIGYTPDASMNPPKATAKAPSSGASAASEK